MSALPATPPAPQPKPNQTVRVTTGPGPAAPARISSDQLFLGRPELLIDHHGMLYRLKQTALGKLILTK